MDDLTATIYFLAMLSFKSKQKKVNNFSLSYSIFALEEIEVCTKTFFKFVVV